MMMTEQSNSQQSVSDLEACVQVTFADPNTNLIEDNKPYISDIMCGKIITAILISAILSPFIICDLYFAVNDVSCVNQHFDQIDINMKKYLLASGIIGVIYVSTLDFYIIMVDINQSKTENFENSEDMECCLYFFRWVNQLFGVAWIILGAVILWHFMDESKCTQQIEWYLYIRFIIGIIGTFYNCRCKNEDKK